MNDTPAKVRFAPSPTGHIHIGNARTALINWLFARKHGGRFVLRFDDTDPERSRAEYADAIAADLGWLGIDPDVVVRQSERLALYQATAERLKAAGRLYPCYETADELDRRRKRRRARGLPPIYDRSALKLSAAERAELEAAGRKPHWRFLLSNFDDDPERIVHRKITWPDLVRGPQTIDLGSLSDPVLIREDGSYLYTLPSVADDIDLAISHVIRGDDHVANTAVQIDLFAALGAAAPRFAHHSLLTMASGEGLSKRKGALSIAGLRAAGYEAAAVTSLAALIGTSDAIAPMADLDDLVAGFDLSKLSTSPARFDPAEIGLLNARLLHETGYDAVAGRLDALGIGGGEAFWAAVRGNLTIFAEAAEWWRIVAEPLAADRDPADAEFLTRAADLLPPEPWDDGVWDAWIAALKSATGRKGKSLFQPLRRALTGRDDGPELRLLLPLIGYRNTKARLS